MLIPTAIVESASGGGGATVILDQTLSVDGQTIDTNPTTLAGFTHLRMLAQLRGDNASNNLVHIRFNNDAGANYSASLFYSNGSGVAAQSIGVTGAEICYAAVTGSPTDDWSFVELFVPFYTDARVKKVNGRTNLRLATGSGNQYVLVNAGTWDSAAAITRIQLFAPSFNFKSGSRLIVYGEA